MKRFSVPIFALAIGIGLGTAVARTSYPPVIPLLDATASIIGEPIEYPEGPPKVTSVIVTMQPGAETGLHRHDAPLFAYILSGEIEVDYGPNGTQTYQAGDAFIEAYQSAHNGHAIGNEEVRILAVFIGAQGVGNTIMLDD